MTQQYAGIGAEALSIQDAVVVIELVELLAFYFNMLRHKDSKNVQDTQSLT